MDVPVAEAISALSVAVTGLLPPSADPLLVPDVYVNPVKTHPSGIGGYVGLSEAPLGAVHARRLQAQVVIRVKADTLSALGAAEVAVSNALVGANRASLRSQGIHRIARDTSYGETFTAPDGGLAAPTGKDIRFDIDFEYRRPPTTAEGVISELPLDLVLNEGTGEIVTLFRAEFVSDPLAAFDLLDDAPITGAPGVWSHDAVNGHLVQTSGAGGGSNAFNASKRGTLAVLKPAAVPTLPASFVLHAEIGADSGGVGLVFNFIDLDNYHFFLMSQPTPYRLLARKRAGNFSFLDEGGQDNGASYDAPMHSLRLVQQGGELELAIDNVTVMTAREAEPPAAGSAGFLSRNSASARFRSIRWLGL